MVEDAFANMIGVSDGVRHAESFEHLDRCQRIDTDLALGGARLGHEGSEMVAGFCRTYGIGLVYANQIGPMTSWRPIHLQMPIGLSLLHANEIMELVQVVGYVCFARRNFPMARQCVQVDAAGSRSHIAPSASAYPAKPLRDCRYGPST